MSNEESDEIIHSIGLLKQEVKMLHETIEELRVAFEWAVQNHRIQILELEASREERTPPEPRGDLSVARSESRSPGMLF